MSELDVRIVKLEPLRVAAAHGFGPSPEPLAWDQIRAYLDAAGLLPEAHKHRFFGFNNPEPSPGSPNYGYEQWVTVGPEAQPAGEIELKDFAGGLYAVTRTSLAEIGQTWQALFAWLEGSPYRFGSQQWLEEAITLQVTQPVDEQDLTQILLDLYMPLAE